MLTMNNYRLKTTFCVGGERRVYGISHRFSKPKKPQRSSLLGIKKMISKLLLELDTAKMISAFQTWSGF
jgi:hypothetical protein